MKTAGIIAEYNPFHKGHAYMLSEVRKSGFDACVAVMSGSFVQRGDVGICSKWARAEMALHGGIDLVVELPVCYSMAGAQPFASAGVALLAALGVDGLCFGSEKGELAGLEYAAELLSSAKFEEALAGELKKGSTFAAARQAALTLFDSGTAALLSQPNNTLAIEYLLAARRMNAPFEAFTVKRLGAAHDGEAEAEQFASASQIRQKILSGGDISGLVPGSTAEILRREMQNSHAPADISRQERIVLAELRCMSLNDFAKLPDVSEGLEHRLYAAARQATGIDDFLARCKTKRYTMARLRRLMFSAFLGLDNSLPQSPPYIKVLGFGPKGAEILKRVKKTVSLPVLTKPAAIKMLGADAQMVFDCESRAQDLWNLFVPQPTVCGADYLTSPIKITEEKTCQ